MMFKKMVFAGIVQLAMLSAVFSKSEAVVETGPAPDMNVHWIHGSENCRTNEDPAFQIFKFDDDTYILRQNKCLDFEAPFLYLLFGRTKALLLDSGSTTPSSPDLQVVTAVQKLINEWLAAHPNRGPIDLVVAHTHSHGDHRFGDSQFLGRSRTTVVSANLPAVQRFFKLTNWPNRTADFDLGGRKLTIIPIPGHETSHIAIYDTKTKVLLTGDTVYPGILVVQDWRAYRLSIHRLAAFGATHQISLILGAHVEMTSTPAKCFPIGSTFQPSEHVLQLPADQLTELDRACSAMGDNPHRDVHSHFVVCPNCNNCEPNDK